MHRGSAEEGIVADTKTRGELDLADDRLAIGHQRQRRVEAVHLDAAEIDPLQLALERAGIGRQFHGNEGAADAGARGSRFQLPHVEAEIVDDAAHPADARFDDSSTELNVAIWRRST